ncbi:hypothetical protein AURDEDRAFT_161493 [Auricularia subglabra TFB-10046 SS5]|nr:hypothetical protein AURDEDRAFT_161493 [Auricularia subglabra TFB-10046 SS5]
MSRQHPTDDSVGQTFLLSGYDASGSESSGSSAGGSAGHASSADGNGAQRGRPGANAMNAAAAHPMDPLTGWRPPGPPGARPRNIVPAYGQAQQALHPQTYRHGAQQGGSAVPSPAAAPYAYAAQQQQGFPRAAQPHARGGYALAPAARPQLGGGQLVFTGAGYAPRQNQYGGGGYSGAQLSTAYAGQTTHESGGQGGGQTEYPVPYGQSGAHLIPSPPSSGGDETDEACPVCRRMVPRSGLNAHIRAHQAHRRY